MIYSRRLFALHPEAEGNLLLLPALKLNGPAWHEKGVQIDGLITQGCPRLNRIIFFQQGKAGIAMKTEGC